MWQMLRCGPYFVELKRHMESEQIRKYPMSWNTLCLWVVYCRKCRAVLKCMAMHLLALAFIVFAPQLSLVITYESTLIKGVVMLDANASQLAFFSAGKAGGVRLHPLPSCHRGYITWFDKWWIPEGSPAVSQQGENSLELTWQMHSTHTLHFAPRKDGQLALLLFFSTAF